MRKPIYFDYNATTPVDERVMSAMQPYFSLHFGNPSSSGHSFGWQAAEAVDKARAQLAQLIGARAKEIYFTSGATESLNMVLRGFSRLHPHAPLITAPTEHRAVLETARDLEDAGQTVHWCPVHHNGTISPAALTSTLPTNAPSPPLAALMMANNELGSINPVTDLAATVHAHNGLLLTDATQAVGKIPIDVTALGVDMMAFSSHKLYGPKGAGALYINSDSKPDLAPLMTGGGQEKGARPGTLNVPAIVGFGAACARCNQALPDEMNRIAAQRDKLEQALQHLGDITINAAEARRLPNTISVTVGAIATNRLLRRFNELALAQGSACSSATETPSHVLRAIGLTNAEARATLRISLGRMTTDAHIDRAITIFQETIPHLRTTAHA